MGEEFKIIKYEMVCHAITEDFLFMVNSLLKEGYQPYGSPFSVSDEELQPIDCFCQAMVKYEEQV